MKHGLEWLWFFKHSLIWLHIIFYYKTLFFCLICMQWSNNFFYISEMNKIDVYKKNWLNWRINEQKNNFSYVIFVPYVSIFLGLIYFMIILELTHVDLGEYIWFNSILIGPTYICNEKINSTNIQLNFLIIGNISNNKQDKTSGMDTND
jgi:hypothetical protein